MLRLKTTIGVAVLSALAASGIAVASASAEQRAYSCQSSAGAKDFNDAHCVTKVGAGSGTFGHGELFGAVAVTTTNANTAANTAAAASWKLASSLSGVATEVQCTGLSGSGFIENEATSVWGGVTLDLTGCSVVKPAAKGCIVRFGTIDLGTAFLTTSGQAAGSVKFTPWAGTEFGKVEIESCTVAPLNNKFPVTGQFSATASGATLTTTEAGVTAQNTLKLGGNKAGLEGSQTLKTTTFGFPVTLT